MGSPKFPKKVHLKIHSTILEIVAFMYMYMIVWAHQRKTHGYVPKNTTYIAHYWCCLLVLRLRQNIQGVPKKTELALCALHSWAKCQKNRQKLDFKKSWNWQTVLMPATVWQFLECKSNPPKMENRCEFAGICLEKLVKWHQLNLFCGGFYIFGTTVHCEHNTLCMVNWLKKEEGKK